MDNLCFQNNPKNWHFEIDVRAVNRILRVRVRVRVLGAMFEVSLQDGSRHASKFSEVLVSPLPP
jgi:hypothetical protein